MTLIRSLALIVAVLGTLAAGAATAAAEEAPDSCIQSTAKCMTHN